METLKPVLARHPFVEGLKDEYYELLEGCASNAVFKADRFIFREGDEANQFYLIRHGKVGLEIFGAERGPITIMTLGEGEVLGWSWLFPPYRWRFDARAIELTRAIALDGQCLRGKCEQDHELGYELMKRVARVVEGRLQATRLQLLNEYASSP
ncbi:MAG TPA: cyclic nucleotide-binding domain-containing protein [Terriglobales bacterium]